jgi:formate dehydrogenase iron-sulfur subunit
VLASFDQIFLTRSEIEMDYAITDPAAVDSFHHLREAPADGAACRGLACFAAKMHNPARWQTACAQTPNIYCLGQCHCGPAVAGPNRKPLVRCTASAPVLLENVLAGGVRDLSTYLQREGGRSLEFACTSQPTELIQLIIESGLRGRGGAGYSAGRKWDAVRRAGREPVVVVNADEGDPGAFSDKVLLEDDPFRVLEGLAIAARAVGSREAYVYLRCEYPMARQLLQSSLTQAQTAGWLGDLSIRLVSGNGSFLCGEETALLNALESRRPFARARPPFPFEFGLHGRPTLVHNVETLACVPWIVRHGAEAYRAIGMGMSSGTKLLSLNSLFVNPGLVEVPFGIALRDIVEQIGGGLGRHSLLGVMIGGPLAGLLPPSVLDTRFTYEELAAIGGAVGHGGTIAFADETSIREIVSEVFRFGMSESCGLCVPCHWGTTDLHAAFAERNVGGMSHGQWTAIVTALETTSLCGHGRGMAEFAHSIERYYSKELTACLG